MSGQPLESTWTVAGVDTSKFDDCNLAGLIDTPQTANRTKPQSEVINCFIVFLIKLKEIGEMVPNRGSSDANPSIPCIF
jgi:hypothetical protein